MIRPAPRLPAGRSLCHSLLFPFAKAADAYAAPAASALSAPRRKLPLDERADGWYTEGNNRQGAYTAMIKILFICHGNILRSLEKPVISMVFIAQTALTTPQLHHLRKSFDVTKATMYHPIKIRPIAKREKHRMRVSICMRCFILRKRVIQLSCQRMV